MKKESRFLLCKYLGIFEKMCLAIQNQVDTRKKHKSGKFSLFSKKNFGIACMFGGKTDLAKMNIFKVVLIN